MTLETIKKKYEHDQTILNLIGELEKAVEALKLYRGCRVEDDDGREWDMAGEALAEIKKLVGET